MAGTTPAWRSALRPGCRLAQDSRPARQVAAEYFRSGADKVSIGSDAVYAAEEYLRTGKKTGSTSLEQISYVYGNQAVVVSIDPRRTYVKDPSEVPHHTIKTARPGRRRCRRGLNS
jgi:imidazole glycerol phosphate synthase subunit HisF